MIGDLYNIGYGEQTEGIKTPIRPLGEGSFIAIVEQGFLGSLLVPSVDWLSKSPRFMDVLTLHIIGTTSCFTPIAAFVNKHDD